MSGIFCTFFFVKQKLSDVDFVKKIIHSETGLELICDEINVKYSFFSLNIKAKELKIKEENSPTSFLKLNNSYIKINLLPLLFGKIKISEFLADDAVIDIKRLEDGTFDFSKYIKQKNNILKVDLSSLKTNILGYKVNLCDYISFNQFLFNGSYLKTQGLDFDKKLAVDTKGEFIILNRNSIKASPFLIDVDFIKKGGKLKLNKQDIILSSFDLSFIKNYIKGVDIKKLDTKVDIYSTSEKKDSFVLYLVFDYVNAAFDYKGDINTLISDKPLLNKLVFNFQNNTLDIKEGEFFADGAKILYSGKIKNITASKKAEIDLDVKIKNTSAGKLAKILPDTVIPMKEQYIKNIKKYNTNGFADGNIHVVYKNEKDYKVNGKIDFSDVYVLERPKNAKTAFGSCEFTGHDVLINVYVPAPNNAILTVFGKSELKRNPAGNFDIKSNGKIDLEFAHKILMPVKDILALKLGPLPYMKIKGTGEIDLKTKGSKEKAMLFGYFKSDDATVALNELNTVLTGGKVKIDFKEYKFLFNGATGIIEGAQTQIDGSANTNGDMNVIVNVKNAPAKAAMKIAQTSPIVLASLDGGEFLKSFHPESGNIDFYLNLYGNIPPDAVFGEKSDSVFAKGKIVFKGNSLTIDPAIKGSNLKGELSFENSCDFNLTADIFDSPFKIAGKVYQKGANGHVVHGVPSSLEINFKSDDVKSSSVGNFILDNISLFAPQNRLFAKSLAKVFNAEKFKLKADVSAKGLVHPNSTTLDLSNFDFNGFIQGVNSKDSGVNFKGGNIVLKGKTAKFEKLRILISKIEFLLEGHIDKFVSNKPFNNLNITLFNSSLSSYADLFVKLLNEKQKNIFSNFSDYTGLISGKIKLYGDKINGEIIPSNVSFTDNKTKSKITLKDGKILFRGDKTYLKQFNFLYGDMPVYIDGYAQTDGRENPELNLYVNTNINNDICDRVLNPNLKYPLSVTGDISLKGRIQGNMSSYLTYLTVVADKGSDISFMGVTLGDINFKREISSKIKFSGSDANIDYIRYFKYLNNNNKIYPTDIIKISGGINIKNNDVAFRNFKIVTPNPAPVRLMNIIFKRSLLKHGTFTSNLVLNGTLNDIKANGTLVFEKVFLPIYESVIENINVDLNQKTGLASFKISFQDTLIDFIVKFENKLTLPAIIDELSVHSEYISIENLMKAFTTFADSASKIANTPHAIQNQTYNFTPSDIQIKKGTVNVDKISFNGVDAKNLKINFSHKDDASLRIDDSYLGIAGGLFKGKGSYNFDSKAVDVSANFINCDVNDLTKAFFNLSGEIYGSASGNFTLSMKDYTPVDYVEKINASADFDISNGKMPRLGSIEYLLRASNLIRSGIFGLTLNNVIEVLKPYRQGDFNKISGNFKIKNASINDLKIYSQGDSLSTYTSGTYSIASGISDIEILGKLSKKVSNLLGPIGNASVSSVLKAITRNKSDEVLKSEIMKNVNKIPLIGLDSGEYRLFNVKLQGEFSKSDAVKSFMWLN